MINKTFIGKLKKEYRANESERRQIISLSNVILHDSKRAIFALHRGNIEKAQADLAEIAKIIKKLETKFGFKRISAEGSYKAGVEEYVEARTFLDVVSGRKVNQFKGLKVSYESYIGGICDLTGELVRRAVNEAAAGRYDEVEKISGIIKDIMGELVEFDMTGYLRTKYDQAKRNLGKIESVMYDIKIRQ